MAYIKGNKILFSPVVNIFDKYNEGKQAGEDALWDALQDYGNRKIYAYAFEQSNFEILDPKYGFDNATNFYYAFYQSKAKEIVINSYNATTWASAFESCKDLRKITGHISPKSGSVEKLCKNCINLVEIEILDFTNISATNSTTAFDGCNSLEEVNFYGVIPYSLNFGDCIKLSRKSIVIITGRLNTGSTGQTITFSKAAIDKAFETSEGAADGSTAGDWESQVFDRPNWTYVLI